MDRTEKNLSVILRQPRYLLPKLYFLLTLVLILLTLNTDFFGNCTGVIICIPLGWVLLIAISYPGYLIHESLDTYIEYLPTESLRDMLELVIVIGVSLAFYYLIGLTLEKAYLSLRHRNK